MSSPKNVPLPPDAARLIDTFRAKLRAMQLASIQASCDDGGNLDREALAWLASECDCSFVEIFALLAPEDAALENRPLVGPGRVPT